ncbi:MAG: hypothetical protein H6R17_3534 [Proteobacteria bacterium]|nr:hypothetical protein [Pseudomonadota bacterium]
MVKLEFVGGVRCADAELLGLLGLAKGAGGQAAQGMSRVFGFAETFGLWQLPRLP